MKLEETAARAARTRTRTRGLSRMEEYRIFSEPVQLAQLESSISAIAMLHDDKVLVGFESGALQLHAYTAQSLKTHEHELLAAELQCTPLLSCTMLGALPEYSVPSHATLAQLGVVDGGGESAFALWAGTLYPLDLSAALATDLLGGDCCDGVQTGVASLEIDAPAVPRTHAGGGAGEPTARVAPLQVREAMAVDDVVCFDVLQSGRVDGAPAEVSRLCAATVRAVHIYSYFGQRFELDVVLGLAAFPPAFSPCGVSWAGVGSVVLWDGSQPHLLPLPPVSWGSEAESHPHPLLRPSHDGIRDPEDAAGGRLPRSAGSAMALPLAQGEVLLLGGEAQGVAMVYDADDPPGAQLAFPLSSWVTVSATVCWPYLISASPTTINVFDLMSGSLVQGIRLPPPGHPTRSGRTASRGLGRSGASPPRLASLSAHAILLGRGSSLWLIRPDPGSFLHTECAWLRESVQRPWDAVLVERQMARVFHSAGHHPLARAAAVAASQLDARLRQLAHAAPPHEPSALAEAASRHFGGSGSQSEGTRASDTIPLDADSRAACSLVTKAVRRLQLACVCMYPPLFAHQLRGASCTREVNLAAELAVFGPLRRSNYGHVIAV